MALSHRFSKIWLEPRVWHGIAVIAHTTVVVQIKINWESERPYAFVLSLQQNDTIWTYDVRLSTREPGTMKHWTTTAITWLSGVHELVVCKQNVQFLEF